MLIFNTIISVLVLGVFIVMKIENRDNKKKIAEYEKDKEMYLEYRREMLDTMGEIKTFINNK